MTRTISLSIESRPECIELLGCALQGLCRLTGLSAADIAKIELAVVEAANNVFEHAYRNQPGRLLVVEFQLATDRVSLLVRDAGEAMDPRKLAAELAEPSPVSPETWHARGRGLTIIKSCMDSVEYQVRDGVNTLAMSRTLDGGGQQSG